MWLLGFSGHNGSEKSQNLQRIYYCKLLFLLLLILLFVGYGHYKQLLAISLNFKIVQSKLYFWG